jgi:hypothetical protein
MSEYSETSLKKGRGPLIVLYVGDYDPSGMFMSECDLPDRLEKYDGGHVELRRVALKREQTEDLASFPASDKKGDKRYKWFVRNFGAQCWELDAMDPTVAAKARRWLNVPGSIPVLPCVHKRHRASSAWMPQDRPASTPAHA